MTRWILALFVVVLVVVAAGIGFLMVWDLKPPLRDIEVVIPSDRFNR